MQKHKPQTMNIYFLVLNLWYFLVPVVNIQENEALSKTFEIAISHQEWDAMLSKHVSATGKVNYKGFKAEEATLDQYLSKLTSNPPQSNWAKNEQLAYWINAYNAFTVKLILNNYPLKSITELKDPWDTPFISIGDKKYTLNQIEHEVIRKQFSEPRIHFAVNCASQSCPELLNRAYTADKLDSQLKSQTRAYINNPKHNVISTDQVTISSIFDWYKEDFTKSGTVIDFLNAYTDKKIRTDAKISYKEYDWNLNG